MREVFPTLKKVRKIPVLAYPLSPRMMTLSKTFFRDDIANQFEGDKSEVKRKGKALLWRWESWECRKRRSSFLLSLKLSSLLFCYLCKLGNVVRKNCEKQKPDQVEKIVKNNGSSHKSRSSRWRSSLIVFN